MYKKGGVAKLMLKHLGQKVTEWRGDKLELFLKQRLELATAHLSSVRLCFGRPLKFDIDTEYNG